MKQQLHTRTSRRNLKSRHKPYYQQVAKHVALSYRRGVGQSEGRWGVRVYAGDKRYVERALGAADDVRAADGKQVLDFDQAQDVARRAAKQTFSLILPECPLSGKADIRRPTEMAPSRSAYYSTIAPVL